MRKREATRQKARTVWQTGRQTEAQTEWRCGAAAKGPALGRNNPARWREEVCDRFSGGDPN
eukprot:4228907-Pyramimonas_sp.AAC.1